MNIPDHISESLETIFVTSSGYLQDGPAYQYGRLQAVGVYLIQIRI